MDEYTINQIKYQTACIEMETAENANLIAVTLGLKPYRDGTAWCVALHGPKEKAMPETLIAFGDTPHKAMQSFQELWFKGDGPTKPEEKG